LFQADISVANTSAIKTFYLVLKSMTLL